VPYAVLLGHSEVLSCTVSEERMSDLLVLEDRSSPNIISVLKSRTRWAECVTRIGEMWSITI
jgi:hypothetical protein